MSRSGNGKKRLSGLSLFLVGLSFFIFHNCSPGYREFDKKLVALDSIATSNPQLVLDSLSKLQNSELFSDITAEQNAYFNLVKVIAIGQLEDLHMRDSLASIPYRYYRTIYKAKVGGGYKVDKVLKNNYGRSSLYYAIQKYNNRSNDTVIYSLFKEAQMLLEELNNKRDLARACSFLAIINEDYRNTSRAGYYYNQAVEKLSEVHDTLSLVNLKLHWSTTKLMTRKIHVVDSILIGSIKPEDLKNNSTKFSYYTLVAAFYALTRERDSVLKYKGLADSLSVSVPSLDMPMVCYAISRYNSYLGNIDTAIQYANRAISYAIEYDATSERIHFYFRNLADIYHWHKDYYNSAITYRKAFVHSLGSSSLFHISKMKEMEFYYNDLLRERDRLDRKTNTFIMLISFISIVLLLIAFISVQQSRRRIDKIEKKNLELSKIALEGSLEQSKAMTDVVSMSLGVLPDFVDKVNKLSSKFFSVNPEIYEAFQQEIDSVKGTMRKRLVGIVNNSGFINTSQILKYISTFSDREKMIMLLLEQKYTTKYIASVLSISQSSVRASKTKMKAKVIKLDIPDKIKEEILSLL